MSRSYRLPWIKDRPRNIKKSTLYWRVVRRVLKQLVKQNKEPKSPKEIVNDWNHCDYRFVSELKKHTRK